MKAAALSSGLANPLGIAFANGFVRFDGIDAMPSNLVSGTPLARRQAA